MVNKTKTKLNFLSDTPVLKNEKDYYEFYHKHVSPALHEIIRTDSKIQTVGLFGAWGSGKSTIIDNLKQDYKDFPIFIFDNWKYQGDPLRRTFLIKLFQFVDDNGLWLKNKSLQKSSLDNLYESNTTSITESIKNEKIKGFWRKLWKQLTSLPTNNPLLTVTYIVLVVGILLWIFGQYFLGEKYPVIAFLLKIPGILSLSATSIVLIGTIVNKAIETMTEKLLKGVDIDLKTQTIIKSRDFLNSPEQFEEKFNDILDRVSKKIVIVFDNIDRVQGDTAIEMLTCIKTFLDPIDRTQGGQAREAQKAIFIIPCDSEAVIAQIQKYYGKNETFDPSEYLRKLFNIIIWTPDFIFTDLEDFTRKSIAQIKYISDLVVLDDLNDLVLVVSQAFRSNPREIKQFLNNLTASLLVARQTEVWNIISKNIPYLAKTLALKQKYPEAYKKLKVKWYDPENILEADGAKDVARDFVIATSSITVINAEPYIYYKLPNRTKGIKQSEELATSLAVADKEKSKAVILANKSRLDKLYNFFEILLYKYNYDKTLLTNIVTTLLSSFVELSINLDKASSLLNKIAECIDRQIWSEYMKIPSDSVFDKVVNNTKVKKVLRETLIARFVVALSNDELKTGMGVDKALEIINNLKKTKLTDSQISDIQRYLAEGFFTDLRVVSNFKSHEEQKRFVSATALENYIKSIKYENYTSNIVALTQYKKLIVELDLGGLVVDSFSSLINQERTKSPQSSNNKQLLFETLKELFNKPDSLAIATYSQNLLALGIEVVEAYRVAGDLNSKFYILPTLFNLQDYLADGQTEWLTNFMSEFIRYSSIEALKSVVDALHDDDLIDKFFAQYINQFKERVVSKSIEEVSLIYGLVNDSNKQQIIDSLVDRQADLGLSFIQSLSEVPDRLQTLEKVLNRINQIPMQGRTSHYDWVTKFIQPKDGLALKNLFVVHLKQLLNSDDPVSQMIGFNALQATSVLNITNKKEIAEEMVEWISTPGKVVNSNYQNILSACVYLFDSLNISNKTIFINIIFGLLDHENDRSLLEMATNLILQIRPEWEKYKGNFIDIGEKLKGWTNTDNKNYVVQELVKLKPIKQKKEEKEYWKQIESIQIGG